MSARDDDRPARDDDRPSRPPLLRTSTFGVMRALGWAAFAGAPILLASLALASARPTAPPSLVPKALVAASIAAGLAFAAATLAARGGTAAARRVGGLAGLVVVGFCAFLVWLSLQIA